MSINHASILSRVRKAIQKIEERESVSGVHLVSEGDDIDHLNGLVIILTRPPKRQQNNPILATS